SGSLFANHVGDAVITQRLLRQVQALLHPLAVSIANMLSRGIVQRVDDSGPIQTLQLGALADEELDECLRLQSYGVTSHPPRESQVVVACPGGDRSTPLVLAVGGNDGRPSLEEGEVALYNSESGSRVVLLANGDIRIEAAGAKVIVDDGSGAEPVIRRSEFLAHTHPAAMGPTGTPVDTNVGSTVLEAK
ncbi:MAG: phage baseplate assembly protein V, partial [Mycobacterium sp.]